MLPIVELLVGPITGLLEKVIPDLDERKRLAHEIATMTEKHAHTVAMEQIKVNSEQAAHKSLFVAGARPAAMWVCVLAMANNYLIAPYIDAFTTSTIPVLDLSVMMPVLLGTLGLGTMRSYEKARGVARSK